MRSENDTARPIRSLYSYKAIDKIQIAETKSIFFSYGFTSNLH